MAVSTWPASALSSSASVTHTLMHINHPHTLSLSYTQTHTPTHNHTHPPTPLFKDSIFPTVQVGPIFLVRIEDVLNEQLVAGEPSPGNGHELSESQSLAERVALCVLWQVVRISQRLSSTASTQCDAGPVCVPTNLLSTYFNPVWCWSSVSPLIELLPIVILVQCVSP